MTGNSTRIDHMACGLLVAALLSGPAAASAVAVDTGRPSVRVTDARAEQRIVIAIGPVAADPTGGATFAGAVRLPRAIMLHRVTITLSGTDGALADGTVFEASLSGSDAGRGLRPLMHFAAGLQVVELPRPLGLQLEQGDSVAIHGSVSGRPAGAVHVHVTLEYEPLEGPASRWAVVPVQIQLDGAAVSEWVAPVDGRVLAFAGVSDVAGELILEDGETGAALWREVLQPSQGEAFGGRGDAVRVGAAIQAGRLYRLTLVSTESDAAPAGVRQVHALLMPIRSAAVAARN
jgi:hypothetical protein